MNYLLLDCETLAGIQCRKMRRLYVPHQQNALPEAVNFGHYARRPLGIVSFKTHYMELRRAPFQLLVPYRHSTH